MNVGKGDEDTALDCVLQLIFPGSDNVTNIGWMFVW